MFVLRGELPTTGQVVIVDIDEKSLKAYGQWPWSRDLIAQLLYNLSDAGAGIIGLDIVFAEADRSSPHRYAKRFASLAGALENYDAMLADALMQTPVIGGYVFTFEKSDEQRTPSIPAIFIESGMRESPILTPNGVVLNIKILQDAMYSSGFFNNTPDEDGMIRSVPLVMKYDGIVYSSLPLEMLRVYSGVRKVKIIGDDAGVKNIRFGDFDVPTDSVGRLLVNFRGAGRHFKYISAADILQGDFNTTDVANKFILLGTSAVGLFDLRSIPFDNAIAGVEVHANEIDNILQGDYLYQPADIVSYDLVTIWAIVFIFLLLFSYIESWYIIPVAIAILFALFELFFRLLFEYGVALNLLFPLMAYVLSIVVSVGIDYIISSRHEKQAKRMLGKKVSPAVMKYLLKHSKEGLIASKELEATIFFSDIRSFTTISEKIGSPDRVIRMLNAYMTPMVENIVKNRGTIDKFIGDAIMAYWNAPVAIEAHADRAVQSAIEQIEKLQEINGAIIKEYDVSIKIGIGIHTGRVTAGDMGSEGRSDYTIIGDNVNLASRLEGLTKQYGVAIIISKATYDRLESHYCIRPLDLVEVKGKSQAVEIYEVLPPSRSISHEEMDRYLQALTLFREAKVAEAHALFVSLQEQFASKLYAFYIKRCDYFLENEDVEFTPILTMKSK